MITLALNPFDQIKSELPGCITDDLLINFETYYNDFLTIKSFELTERQLYILSEIDIISNDMNVQPLYIYSEEEIETTDYSKILESEEWNKIRSYAIEFIDSMKWDIKDVTRYKQVDQNVWHKNKNGCFLWNVRQELKNQLPKILGGFFLFSYRKQVSFNSR